MGLVAGTSPCNLKSLGLVASCELAIFLAGTNFSPCDLSHEFKPVEFVGLAIVAGTKF